MPKTRTTLTVDEDLLRTVRIRAARTGKRDSQVIEEALRRDFGLDTLEEIWAKVRPVSEEEGMKLAVAEQHAMREEQRASGGS
jgi:gamma-glutamyl:cysteine ligase YbdK (ATP-grasp superfamily)